MKDSVNTGFRLGFHLNICLYLSMLKTGQENIWYCIKNGTEEYIDMLTLPYRMTKILLCESIA